MKPEELKMEDLLIEGFDVMKLEDRFEMIQMAVAAVDSVAADTYVETAAAY